MYQYVRERGCDGIICGHIHMPGVISSEGMKYINTGDWVENCTALVENHDGELTLESFFPARNPQAAAVVVHEPIEQALESVACGECVTEFAESVA